jgi:hypothetical protein
MKIPALLNSLLQFGATFYLVTHGVSLPAEAQWDLPELGSALYWSSLAWLISLMAPVRQAVVGLMVFILMVAGASLGVGAASAQVLRQQPPAGMTHFRTVAGSPETVTLPPSGEVAPPRPGPDYLWVPGHWAWRGRDLGYVWMPGRWVLPARSTRILAGR